MFLVEESPDARAGTGRGRRVSSGLDLRSPRRGRVRPPWDNGHVSRCGRHPAGLAEGDHLGMWVVARAGCEHRGGPTPRALASGRDGTGAGFRWLPRRRLGSRRPRRRADRQRFPGADRAPDGCGGHLVPGRLGGADGVHGRCTAPGDVARDVGLAGADQPEAPEGRGDPGGVSRSEHPGMHHAGGMMRMVAVSGAAGGGGPGRRP